MSKPGQWWLTAKDAAPRKDTQAGQSRAAPRQRSRRGLEPARLCEGKPRLGRQTKGCRGPGAVGAVRSRRGVAGYALSPRPDSRVPCHPRVPGPRSGSTCCTAGTPRSANHPPARGSRHPARPPLPPGPHLLVGCGEVLSDHGPGPLRLTRDRDAAGGTNSEKRPLH